MNTIKLKLFLLSFFLQHSILNSAEIEYSDLEEISISDTMVMVPMRDGVRLATDIFRPKEANEELPLILIKTPYDFNEVRGSSLQWTYQAVKREVRI